MKQFLALAILVASCLSAFSQTKADYEHAIQKIGKFYNRKLVDSLLNMYSPQAQENEISIWTGKQIDELRIRYGKMQYYEYAGEYKGMALFKTEFTRSTHMVGLSIEKDGKLSVFRFKLTSTYTDSLLQRK